MKKLITILAMVFLMPVAMAGEKLDLLAVDFGLKWPGNERSGMQMLMEKGKPAKAIWNHQGSNGSRPEKGELRIIVEDVFVAKNGMPAVKLHLSIMENKSGELIEIGSMTPSLALGRSGILHLEQAGKSSIELDINVRHASPEEIEITKGKQSISCPSEDQSKNDNGGCCYVGGPPCTGVWQCCGAISCCCGSRCCYPQ